MLKASAKPGAGLFSRRNLQSVGVLTFGNAAAAGLGLVLLLILAGTLTPAELAVVISIIAIIDGGQLFLDTVFNPGIVSVASRQGADERPDDAILRAGFWAKAAGGLIFALLVAVVAVPMSEGLLDDRSLVGPLMLAGVAAALAGMQSFVGCVLMTRGQFARLAFASLWKNAFRIAFVAPFLFASRPDPHAAAIAVSLATVGSLSLALFLIRWDFIADRSSLRSGLSAIQKLNGWMIVVAFCLLGGRLDVWLVGLLSDPRNAGHYALAAQLCIAVGVVTQAVIAALLPGISRIRDPLELGRFLKDWLYVVPLLALGLALAFLFSEPVIRIVFGAEYAAAAPTFNVLFAAALMTLSTAPLTLVLFCLEKTYVFALGAVLQLALRVAFAVPFVAAAGALGMAHADVTSRVIAMAVIGYFVWKALQSGLTPAAKEVDTAEDTAVDSGPPGAGGRHTEAG